MDGKDKSSLTKKSPDHRLELHTATCLRVRVYGSAADIALVGNFLVSCFPFYSIWIYNRNKTRLEKSGAHSVVKLIDRFQKWDSAHSNPLHCADAGCNIIGIEIVERFCAHINVNGEYIQFHHKTIQFNIKQFFYIYLDKKHRSDI